MVAVGLSLLAHVSFFALLTLKPQHSIVPVKEQMQEKPLEVTIEAAVPQKEPETAGETSSLIRPVTANPNAIQTQLDPAHLKKTDKAPENATEIASYNSQATRPKAGAAATPENPLPVPPSHSEPAPADSVDSAATFQSAPKPVDPGKPGESGPDDEVGIDAIGTYSKSIGDAVNRPWEYFRQTQNLPVGEVRLKFTVDAEGRISDVGVISNTGTEANAKFALLAVKGLKFPPIPPEVLAKTPRGCIEVTYTFNNFPLQ